MGGRMRAFSHYCFAVAALLGLALLHPAPAAADQLVKFASAGAASSPGFGIQGYLTRPKGDGPFPAVVLLHSCLGLPADRQSIGNTLARWGYVALFVDDFATRGLRETCEVDFPEGLADAFGALGFVAGLPYVDRGRIAAVGYSQGAATALQIAALGADSGFSVPDHLGFRAVAAFYPGCAGLAGARLRLPTVILIGAADSVTPAADCQRLVGRQSAAADLKLVVYPGAAHVFADPEFAGGRRLLGMWLQFDPKAAAQSRSALRDFLAAKLGR
jgi:dienelactone hydrolase